MRNGRFYKNFDMFTSESFNAFADFENKIRNRVRRGDLRFTNMDIVKKYFFGRLVLACSAEEFLQGIWQTEHSPEAYEQELRKKMNFRQRKTFCFDMFYYEIFCELMGDIRSACEKLIRETEKRSPSPLEKLYMRNFIANAVLSYFYEEYAESLRTCNQ